MPLNSNFRLPRGHRFFPKNGSYGYGAKWGWGPPRVHLGANGVPMGKKRGQNRKNLQCPKIRIFDYPRGHRFFAKNGSYIYSAKSRSGLPRVHLGANGVALCPKNGSIGENYHAPKIELATNPRSSIFSKKWKLRLWRQIRLGTS